MALGCTACNGYFGLAGFGLGDDGTDSADFSMTTPAPISTSIVVPYTPPPDTGYTYTDPATEIVGGVTVPTINPINLTSNQSTVNSSGGGSGVNWNNIAA